MCTTKLLPIIATSTGITIPCRITSFHTPEEEHIRSPHANAPLIRIRISAQWVQPHASDENEASETALSEFFVHPPETIAHDLGAAVFMIAEPEHAPHTISLCAGSVAMGSAMDLPRFNIIELLRIFGGELLLAGSSKSTDNQNLRISQAEHDMLRDMSDATNLTATLLSRLSLQLLHRVIAEDFTDAPFHISPEDVLGRFGGNLVMTNQKMTPLNFRTTPNEKAACVELSEKLKVNISTTTRLALHLLHKVMK